MKKHLLLITQHFSPEIGAAATRWGDYTQLLKDHFEITVLTSVPNYPKQHVFDGYKNKYQTSTENGITVVRVPTIPRKANSNSRILNYLFFVISAISCFYKIQKPSFILVSSPPLTVGIVGIFYKLIYNIPLYLDVRDLWPETAIDLGELNNPIARKIGFKLKSIIYANSEKFITPIPSFIDDFPKNKPTYPLLNGISDSFIQSVDIKMKRFNFPVTTKKPLKVLYAGNHGLLQGLEHILYVAKDLESVDKEIHFTLIGDGSNKRNLERLSSELELNNTFLIDSMGKEDLIEAMLSHDIGLVSLKKTSLFERALPSKTFEYAGAGLMILSTVPGDLANLIQQHNMGVTVYPENHTQMKDVLIKLNKNRESIQFYQENAYSVARKHFKKSILAEGLSTFMGS